MLDHSKIIKMHFSMIQRPPKEFWSFSGVWSVGSTWYCILWWYEMSSNFVQHYQVVKDHSKITKMHFWMIQSAKKVFFGHFLVFGLLDRLDIAYSDSNRCLPTLCNIARSWRIIQRSQKCIFEWSKELKKRFCAIFCSFVCWIYLILPKLFWMKKSENYWKSKKSKM